MLAFYAANVASRGHFDDQMLELKAGLLRLDGTPGAEPPDIIPGIAGHLVAPMPVYIEMWWSEHDRANCARVDLVSLKQTLADRNVSASLPGTARCQLPKRLPLSPGCDLLYSLYARERHRI